MTRFTATIRHHSISRARMIDCGSDLAAAKRLAADEFDSEQRDYTITIYGQRDGCAPEIYAERAVAGRKWQDR